MKPEGKKIENKWICETLSRLTHDWTPRMREEKGRDEELVSGIYKELKTSKKTNNLKIEQQICTKEERCTNSQKVHEKMLIIISH